MAKKAYSPDPKAETIKRIQRTEAYAEKVRQLFAATVNEILALNKSVPTLDEGVMYSFDGDNMRIQKKVEALLRQLHSTTTTAIKKGITLEWEKANDACDKLISSCFGKEVLSSPEFSAWNNRNMAAMNAFTNRTENGLNLSKRIWQSVQQLRDEMEIAMTVAIGEGDSAQSISRKVRQYLNDPDLMFRRFRFKKGEDEQGKPIYGRKWKKRIKDEKTNTDGSTTTVATTKPDRAFTNPRPRMPCALRGQRQTSPTAAPTMSGGSRWISSSVSASSYRRITRRKTSATSWQATTQRISYSTAGMCNASALQRLS